jgi:hypothetical protein
MNTDKLIRAHETFLNTCVMRRAAVESLEAASCGGDVGTAMKDLLERRSRREAGDGD